MRTARLRSGLGGSAIGMAVVFACWVMALRLDDMTYHFGTVLDSTLVDDASVLAGMRWIEWSGAGAILGGLIGSMVAGLRPIERFIQRLAPASAGVYLLSLRGAWGYDGPPPVPGEAAVVPVVMPTLSILVPALMAAAAVSAILLGEIRPRSRTHPEPDRMATLVGVHACLSFTAVHATMQLPYYLGAAGPFLTGLGVLVRSLTPPA